MKVGLYPGSFKPFHKGHYNILQKSEAIFDKVILGFGFNPEKDNINDYPPPKILSARDVRFYDGLLTDFIQSLEYDDVTVIRGLRNSNDLHYELNKYRFLQELMPDIKVISIFCDKEFEHISSSAIRLLQRYGKAQQYLV